MIKVCIDIARQFDGVFRALDTGKDHASDAALVSLYSREREMRTIADRPQAYLVSPYCSPQVLDIVGTLICVITRKIDARLSQPLGTGSRPVSKELHKLLPVRY